MPNLDPALVGYKDIYDSEILDKNLISIQDKYTEYLIEWHKYLPYINNVTFCYINDFSINALTNIVNSDGVVALNIYAPLLFSDLFYGLLSHPSVFPEYGQSKLEVPKFTNYSIPKQLKDLYFEKEDRLISVKSPRWIPEIAQRCTYASILSEIAIDFLFLHEMGHLLRGHSPFRREILKIFEPLTAFGDTKDSEDFCLVNHALEYDADWFAMKYIIDFSIRDQLPLSKLNNLIDHPRFLFETIIIAIVLVILSGDLSRYETIKYKNRIHPHPYWRFLTLYAVIDCTLGELHPELKKYWKPSFYDALIDLRYIAEIYEPARRYFSDAPSMQNNLMAHYTKIVKEQARIAKILESSSHYFASVSH